MGKFISSLIFFLSAIFSSFPTQIDAIKSKNQIGALRNLYRAKLFENAPIDKRHFQASGDLHSVKFPARKKEDDLIHRLPGQPEVEFEQYGGYVTVNENAGRALYYYFTTAQHSKDSSSPLLLWLNGGPGCSSLAYGAMQELGPFRVRSDGKTLFRNKYSWNYAANVLFLESPAGVGFSYSNTSTDYVTSGDSSTAIDNYIFLINWLERFPEFKKRDFYIAGESYAGHYVPQLAHTILYHNTKPNNTFINLRGILIGNAVINDETDTRGMYDYFGSHALSSPQSIYEIQKYCDFSPNVTNQSEICLAATDQADQDTQTIDIYNIYAPLCLNPNLTLSPKKASVNFFDPCSEIYVHAYMNRPDVQEAMHANVTKLNFAWQSCSDIVSEWLDSPSTIVPLLHEFMAKGIRVWIFSGDTDGRIPVTSTQYSIDAMNLSIKTTWRPWYNKGEVGGYTQVYKGDITFATVRGAGHQVPSYEPLRALALFMHFLAGTPLPNSQRTFDDYNS